jgi:serine/threonine protein kinase
MYKYENFIGKVLDSRYKILELVGLGGMAFVLKAEDLVMNRIVAIKILNDEYNGNEQAETRFINESKAVAMLSHKNIVGVYDVAIYPDMKYIVMEYLDGITFREYLDNKGALPWKEACVYILQILRALEHAHSKGVIHRDIKPQNVILQKNGEIKVTDFGIAKIPNTPALTMTEKAIGTVYYISPEQASGKPTDFYSDIYSVGVMLYEAVTGKLPFTAESPLSIAMMQVSQAPKNPRELVPSIPVGVSQIILKAMEKEPGSRFSSAHSMCKAIEWILRNPQVVFNLEPTSTEAQNPENAVAVSIDMIDTGEIQDYGDSEIAEALGKESQKPKKKSKDKEKAMKSGAKKSRSMFPIILGVASSFLLVALVLGVLAVYNLFFGEPDNPDSVVTYPNLVGEVWNSELKAKLNNKSFGAYFDVDEIIYAEHKDFSSGQIIATEPPAGQISKKSSKSNDRYYHFTSITVCKKLEDVIVPDVTYFTQSEAKTKLQGEGIKLKVNLISESNYDFFDGQVIRTEPSAGSIAKVGENINVVICQRTPANKADVMPNLTGLSKIQAENMLKYANYTYEFVQVPSLNGTN